MAQHTRTAILIIFLLSIEFGFGQCSKAKLLQNFILNGKKYNAVTFSAKKYIITINSFDLKDDFDTLIVNENYWCIRGEKTINYLKSNKNLESSSTLLFNDTLLVESNKSNAFKKEPIIGKQVEFQDALYFLGDDSIQCDNFDSIVNRSINSINAFSSFEDEYGSGSVQFEYNFNSIGNLVRKEIFYNHEALVPKVYTIVEFSNIKYYVTIPKTISDKFKTEYKRTNALLKLPKKKTHDSSTYIKSNSAFDLGKLKPITFNGKPQRLDSIILSNKVTLIYFWFQGCRPCSLVKPELTKIYTDFHKKGLQIVGLNDVDNQLIIDSTSSVFKNYMDNNRNIELFKIGYPQIILFNAKGEILGKLYGYSINGIKDLNKHIELILN